MNMIICGKDCEDCRHGNIDDSNKARVKVYCSYKEKSFYWGTCIPCENKTKRVLNEGDNNTDEN